MKIEGYELLERLNRGRELDVYDAWSEERDCRCVAKVLRPDRVDDRGARRRLLSEGRLLESLAHPHIVRAYEVLERPLPLVALETLDGETLSYMLHARRRRLPAGDIAFLGLHLCSAIGYLHRHGYLHLDLKPSNVISDRGQAKVIDLSIARRPGRVRAGVGTWQYMAPEQARGGSVSEATDAWGIGAVLFVAATGARPFRSNGDGGSYEQLERRADPVRRHRRLPRALADVVDACLDPVPAARPPVCRVSEVLDAFADRLP
jgi:serine/threonine protein kinase